MKLNSLYLTMIILNVSMMISFAFYGDAKVSRYLRHHHGRCSNSHSHSQARVAIGFFGISRNLSSTVGSIERHVFDALHRSNISYDVFWSTVSAAVVKSTRGDEVEHGEIDPYDVQLIRPCRMSIVDQDTLQQREFELFLHARNITTATMGIRENRHRYDVWKDSYGSVKNVLCAFYSQKELEEMIRTYSRLNNFQYDAVIALRPDTAMLRDIDLPKHLHEIRADSTAIWIPSFQHWGGLNDRGAYGSVDAMSIYLRRGLEFRDSDLAITGEALLKQVVQRHKLAVHDSDIRVVRVRQNGRVSTRDTLQAMNMTSNDFDVDYQRCVDSNSRNVLPSC